MPASAIKILVSHHPFHRPPGHEHERLVGGAAEALHDLGACQADLILSGHLHISHTHSSVELFEAGGHSVLLVQAVVAGQGVAVGRRTLVAGELAAGRLVRPFDVVLPVDRAYYLVCPEAAAERPKIAAFRAWLLEEAAQGEG